MNSQIAIWLFTFKLKRNRKLRDTESHPAAMYPDVSKTDLWWGETAKLCGVLRYAYVGYALNTYFCEGQTVHP